MKPARINFVVRMQHWMDSVPGQTFLNYAYSWGASIVILGTLFKLTHLPGANLMLFIGMGTEVVVFFLSAFDRPFDKSEIGRELSDDYPTDEEISAKMTTPAGSQPAASVQGGSGNAGGTIIIGGGIGANGSQPAEQPIQGEAEQESHPQSAGVATTQPQGSLSGVVQIAGESLLQQAQATATPELEEASKEYVEKLKLLTETLDRVEKQCSRLTTDSEEMTNLNRTLTGINTIYELQLKSISQQVGSIDNINEQTRRMAAQIEELNGIYARMIKALTVNMKNAAANTNVH